jgi:FtsP/CotA-like multicopper oxidase with cupredoxin domain
VDFSRFQPGERVTLRSRPLEIPGMMGMMGMSSTTGGGAMGRGRMGGGMGGMAGMGGLPQGAPMDFVEFVIGDERGPDAVPLPQVLSQITRPMPGNDATRRTFRFESLAMQHTINGRVFEMGRAEERVPLGETEIWSIRNDSGFPHPVHIHVGQFRILGRTGGREALMPWEAGLKDTVLVLPGEEVDVAVRFDNYEGMFLLHCHNLEHEDRGMMMNFAVE